jgi:predicted transcriptional regulator
VFDEFRDYEVEFVVVEELVDSHYVRMTSSFQYLKFIFHKFNQNLVFINFIFSDNFYRAFYVGGPMHSYANLAKTAFAKNAANFVSFFDICYFFESAKVFEI